MPTAICNGWSFVVYRPAVAGKADLVDLADLAESLRPILPDKLKNDFYESE